MKTLIAFLLLFALNNARAQTPHGVSAKYFFNTNAAVTPGQWFGFAPWINSGAGVDSSFNDGSATLWTSNGAATRVPVSGIVHNWLCQHIHDTIAGTDTLQLFYSLDTAKTWTRSTLVLINGAGFFESDMTHALTIPAGGFLSCRLSPGSKGGAYGSANSVVYLSLEFDPD